MALLPGVYKAKKKDGSPFYRSSLTFRNKRISLGSFPTQEKAHTAYKEAKELLSDKHLELKSYVPGKESLPFLKWVVLINYRDNGIYIKTPVYLKDRYFIYYLEKELPLYFDVDDLFYYSEHKIMKRGGHLFVSDFGMQVNILSRYGIKNFAVPGRDYRFINGNPCDFRYGNIEVINRYHGVSRIQPGHDAVYISKIHIRGDYIIGRYSSETEAAVAYNKAAVLLQKKGLRKDFPLNYIDTLSKEEYTAIYDRLSISTKLNDLNFYN